jgi:hypothetical protein
VAEESERGGPWSGPVWRRGGIALLLLIAVEIGQFLMNVTAIVQFGWMLVTGRSNAFLRDFGRSLSAWLGQASAYVTCTSEEKPFPWAEWPRGR